MNETGQRIGSTGLNSTPHISVIITCYNYERYVATAIDSVLNQAWSLKELIVVDDASRDRSRDIISAYGEQLIALFDPENRGHGGAFNSGFAKARGTMVLFLDADDFLLPGALELVAQQQHSAISLYQFRMRQVDENGRAYDIFPKPELVFDTSLALEKLKRTGRYQTTVTSGMVYNRTFLEKVMPLPEADFRQGADGYLAALAPLYGLVSACDATPLSAYRQHGSNHSSFGKQLSNRAKWCLQHDEKCHGVLARHAADLGIVISANLADNSLENLEQRMALLLFEPESYTYDDSNRYTVCKKALAALKHSNFSSTNKRVIAAWWVLLALSPRMLGKTLFSWRMLDSSRPVWIKKTARWIRGL